jgi:hypothetical protein
MKSTFLKKFVRNKRAITPVLSELLLTVIAVAAMSVATSATYVITSNMRGSMSERIVVEDVWFNGATHTIDIYVRNVGEVDATISAVYLSHISLSSQQQTLPVDSHQWLHFSSSCSAGTIYYLDIVTTRGTHIAGDYKAT